jgi:hypothetical protein
MSDHGTDHGTFLACTPTDRPQRTRESIFYPQNTDHETDHGDHAPSDHAHPPVCNTGGVRSTPGRVTADTSLTPPETEPRPCQSR